MSDHNQANYTRRRNILNQTNRKYLKCSHCDFSTNWPLLLKRHLWTLHGKCVYKCDKCSFRTYIKKSLDSHKRRYLNYENCNLNNGKYSKKFNLDLMIDSIKQEVIEFVSNNMDNVTQKSLERIKLNLKKNSNKKSSKRSLLKCTYCDFKSYFQIKFEEHIQNHMKCDIQNSSGVCDKLFMKNTANKRPENGRFINIISSEDKKINSEVSSKNFNYFDKLSQGEISDFDSKDSAYKMHKIESENLDMDLKESNSSISLNGSKIARIETGKTERVIGLHSLKYTTNIKNQKVLQDSNYKESCKNIPLSEIKSTRIESGKREMVVVLNDLKYTTNVKDEKVLEEQLKIKNNTIITNSKDYSTGDETSDFDFCGFENVLTGKKNIEYEKHIAENCNKNENKQKVCTHHSNDIKDKDKMNRYSSSDKSFKFRLSNNIFHKCRNCDFKTHMLQRLHPHEVKCFAMRLPKGSPIQTKKKSVLSNTYKPNDSRIYDLTNQAFLSSCKNDLRFTNIKKHFLTSSKIRDKKLLHFPYVSIALDNKLKLVMEKEVEISQKHSNSKNVSQNRKSKLDISSYKKIIPHNEENEISDKKYDFDKNFMKKCRKSSINSNSVGKLIKNNNDDTKWQCQFCNYASKDLSGYKIHLITAHSDRKRFNCKLCDYKNNVKQLLKKHYIKFHSSVIVKRCKESSDSVTQEDVLRELCLPDKNAMNISLSFNPENKMRTKEHKNDENLDVFSNCQTKKQLLSLNTFKRKKSLNLSRNDGLKNHMLSNPNIRHKMRDHKIRNTESSADYKNPLPQNDVKHLTSKSKIRNFKCNENVPDKFVVANKLGNKGSMQNTSKNNRKKVYECPRCHFFTHSVSALGRHTLNECTVRRYGCKKCSFITNQLQLIIEHSSFHHKECKDKEGPVKYEELKNMKNYFNDVNHSTRLVSMNSENSMIETSRNKTNVNTDTDKPYLETSHNKTNVITDTDKPYLETSHNKTNVITDTDKPYVETSHNKTNVITDTDKPYLETSHSKTNVITDTDKPYLETSHNKTNVITDTDKPYLETSHNKTNANTNTDKPYLDPINFINCESDEKS